MFTRIVGSTTFHQNLISTKMLGKYDGVRQNPASSHRKNTTVRSLCEFPSKSSEPLFHCQEFRHLESFHVLTMQFILAAGSLVWEILQGCTHRNLAESFPPETVADSSLNPMEYSGPSTQWRKDMQLGT